MNDQSVYILRVGFVTLMVFGAFLTWVLSYQKRDELSLWQGLTRASMGMLMASNAFATLSNMLGWDPDARVTLLFLSGLGAVGGLAMTAVEEQKLSSTRQMIDQYRATTGYVSQLTLENPMSKHELISSTSPLVPAGIAGYAKGVIATITGVIEAVLPFIPLDSELARALHIVVAIVGAVGVVLVPNKIETITVVTPPTPEYHLDSDEVGPVL